MQFTPTFDIALMGIPGLLLGLVMGYMIGGMASLGSVNRIGLSMVISGVGGLILSLVTSYFITITSLVTGFIILACIGGNILGLVLNWTPPVDSGPINHIIYEEEDDDAFDREIEDALRGTE